MLTQIQLIIEIVLSFFLLLGIIYSFYLSRILSNLKRDRESLMGLVEKLEASVKSAEEGVEKLRVAGEVSGRPLSRMIELARVTGTELDTMVDKADTMADRLEMATIKATPHERRLERLLEMAAEVELDRHPATRNAPAPDSAEQAPATTPAAEQNDDIASESSQPSVMPAEPPPTRDMTPPPAPSTEQAPPKATGAEDDALPHARTSAPTPPQKISAPKNGRNRNPGSARQKSQQMNRLENNFLGRPSR